MSGSGDAANEREIPTVRQQRQQFQQARKPLGKMNFEMSRAETTKQRKRGLLGRLQCRHGKIVLRRQPRLHKAGIDDPNTDTGDPNGNRRASGGPVSGYLVNESAHTRPETLVLGNRNGQVLTKQDAMAAMGGGGMNINGPITIIANDPASFLRQLQAMGRSSRLAMAGGAKTQGVF